MAHVVGLLTERELPLLHLGFKLQPQFLSLQSKLPVEFLEFSLQLPLQTFTLFPMVFNLAIPVTVHSLQLQAMLLLHQLVLPLQLLALPGLHGERLPQLGHLYLELAQLGLPGLLPAAGLGQGGVTALQLTVPLLQHLQVVDEVLLQAPQPALRLLHGRLLQPGTLRLQRPPLLLLARQQLVHGRLRAQLHHGGSPRPCEGRGRTQLSGL